MTDAIRYDKDADGIVTLTIDMSGSANVMNAEYHEAMAATIDRLESEKDDIAGVILTSAKKTFFAGGDLNQLIKVTKETSADFAAHVEEMKAQLRRLEKLGRPVVAAVNGTALGGGLELALACHHRIVLNSPKIKLGLPEVTLGLLPGGGGVTRLVRMLGVQGALPLLTEGKQLRPDKALKAGIVDELAEDTDEMFAKARTWIKGNPEPVQPWDVKGHRVPDLKFADPDSYSLLSAAPAVLKKKTHGTMPAPEKILAAAVEGAHVDFDTALAIEGRYFVELTAGKVSKNMITAFWFNLNEINGGGSRPSAPAKYTTQRLGVLGAGMMGAGIAQVSAQAGISVVLKDVSLDAAESGKAKIAANLDKSVAKGRLTQDKREALLDLITPTGSDADLAGVDLVIEAVFEDRELKGRVTVAAEQQAASDAVIASNTSTLPITGLATAVPDQQRFVGLHFFSPVDRMPLVEIIRGEQTSDETLAKAFDYVLQIKKTPIVVNDSRGFYTSRTFGTYLTEGVELLGDGVHPALIENVSRKAGMAVGPLAVADEVTLTLAHKIRKQTLADMEAAGEAEAAQAYRELPAFKLIDTLVSEGRTGKSGGAGFYEYPEGGTKYLWPELATRYATADCGVTEQDAHDRLLYIQSLETVRCLESGVLTSVGDANIGSIFGFGYAPWTGGTLQFINHVGAEEFVARADYLADTYGERFRPPALLREKAKTGERF